MQTTETATIIETTPCPVCGGVGDTCGPYTDQEQTCTRCGGRGELAMYELMESEIPE